MLILEKVPKQIALQVFGPLNCQNQTCFLTKITENGLDDDKLKLPLTGRQITDQIVNRSVNFVINELVPSSEVIVVYLIFYTSVSAQS